MHCTFYITYLLNLNGKNRTSNIGKNDNVYKMSLSHILPIFNDKFFNLSIEQK